MTPIRKTKPGPKPGAPMNTERTEAVAVFMVDGMFHPHVWLSERTVNVSSPGKWQTAGGKVGAGEYPMAAAVRELREETGLKLRPDRLVPFAALEAHTDDGKPYIVYAYYVQLRFWERPKHAEPDKAHPWKRIRIEHTSCLNGLPRMHDLLIRLVDEIIKQRLFP